MLSYVQKQEYLVQILELINLYNSLIKSIMFWYNHKIKKLFFSLFPFTGHSRTNIFSFFSIKFNDFLLK